MNERLADLIATAAKNAADAHYRNCQNSSLFPDVSRLLGAAKGVEDFAKRITAAPNKPAGTQ